jgi:hypothetical protein
MNNVWESLGGVERVRTFTRTTTSMTYGVRKQKCGFP